VFSTLNRNARSYVMAIVGAEYVLRLLPRGTHDWSRFIRPSELTHDARRAGLDLVAITGMQYNPLARRYALGPDAGVNYLAAFRKPALDA
jgi:2-polyprenyl-6-hydroxyphenyl methylase/3-demethylubiquinone-9 3-methyltransferase